MFKFSFTISFILLFVSVTLSIADPVKRNAEDDSEENNEDIPRYFDIDEAEKCPVEYFYLDCNRCNCEGGSGPDCTRINCPPNPRIDNYKQGKPCPAGKPFRSNCHSCVCGSSGRDATCDERDC